MEFADGGLGLAKTGTETSDWVRGCKSDVGKVRIPWVARLKIGYRQREQVKSFGRPTLVCLAPHAQLVQQPLLLCLCRETKLGVLVLLMIFSLQAEGNVRAANVERSRQGT